MKQLWPIVICLFTGVSLGPGCRFNSASPEGNSNAGEKVFKSDLIMAVAKAHRIEIVEHSWDYDFYDSQGELISNPPHVVYKRTGLTPEQKAGLLAVFEKMPEAPKTMFSACIFEPHHSIEFIRDDESRSVIQICFHCRDTKWRGSGGTVPEAFQKFVLQFIEPLGFQAERDWHELAKNQALNKAP